MGLTIINKNRIPSDQRLVGEAIEIKKEYLSDLEKHLADMEKHVPKDATGYSIISEGDSEETVYIQFCKLRSPGLAEDI